MVGEGESMSIKNACGFVLGFAAFGCALDASEPTSEVADVEPALHAGNLSYEQIDITFGPPEYDFWGPTGLSNAREVYGTGIDCNEDFTLCEFDLLKVGADGQFSVALADFSPSEVNGPGDVGGCVIDNESGAGQAAVYHANGELELIPRLPGELSSCIVQMSDSGTAVVFSLDESFVSSQYVRRGNQNL